MTLNLNPTEEAPAWLEDFVLCNAHAKFFIELHDIGWWENPFYIFKDAVLETLGKRAGFDLQKYNRIWHCNSCGGTGKHFRPGDCHKCGGNGIYRTEPRQVVLERFNLHGSLFHTPRPTLDWKEVPITETIKGLIKHNAPEASPSELNRAFARLKEAVAPLLVANPEPKR